MTLYPLYTPSVQNTMVLSIVLNFSLSEKSKKVLLHLCSRREFLHKRSKEAVRIKLKGKKLIKEEFEITEEERRLARKFFKHILRRPKRFLMDTF